VNGAGDEFFACASLAEDENGGSGGRGQLNLGKRSFERRAFADDLLEVEFGENFFFEVGFFLGESVLEGVDFLEGQCVFDGDGDLAADLLQEFDVLLPKGIDAPAGEVQ